MTPVRQGLPPLPERMRHLPVDERGYPVPRFVRWMDGKPDFRVMDECHLVRALDTGACWICGERVGRFRAYVIGPMCAINRISAEPPSHKECAVFAAQACPFLTMPKAKRREAGLPADRQAPPGKFIPRNPGVALVWVTRDDKPFREGRGVLWDVGDPEEALWFAQGRPATRAEVLASIETGLPLLEAEVKTKGAWAEAELVAATARAMDLLPAEATP